MEYSKFYIEIKNNLEKYHLIQETKENALAYIINCKSDARETYDDWLEMSGIRENNLEDLVTFKVLNIGYEISYKTDTPAEHYAVVLDVIANGTSICTYHCLYCLDGTCDDDYILM
ncbi:hypothetical protein [Butyrivibrio sp. NC3005]|uniref:hypothetical protein n=1 Tax=Butyrivibrio sp. NC3005 TaxID=1280685 RepID=UPI0003F9EFE1|nr:hypothetical protein [Butyrivibrio sp. NC3005]